MKPRDPFPAELRVLQSLVKHCDYGVSPPIKVICADIGNKIDCPVGRELGALRRLGLVEKVLGCWRPTPAGRAMCAPANPLSEFIEIAAERFQLCPDEIKSRRRTATVARARGFVVLQASRAGIPDTAIARGLGRDLSTISYARKRALELEALSHG